MGAQTSHMTMPDHSVPWYRTKVPPDVHTAVHRTSDIKAWGQTLAFMGMLMAWFSLALYCHYRADRQLLAGFFTVLYGTQANFLINAMHELGHGFVFRTRILNRVFMRIVSFLGWLHPDMFFSSHLNFPHDQEAPMPTVLTLSGFLSFGFINVRGCYDIMEQTIRAAAGIYPTKHLWWTPMWEEVCYPPENAAARGPPMRWAQFLLLGHGGIALISVARGLYLVPVLLSLGPFYSGWLFFLCNSTQHTGMHHAGGGGGNSTKQICDFRLTTRSFYLRNPIVRCWYWNMNYHIEHHMYAAVPCYNLPTLHEAIKHDLPPTPDGIWETWKVIIPIMRRQTLDPAYVGPIELPAKKRE